MSGTSLWRHTPWKTPDTFPSPMTGAGPDCIRGSAMNCTALMEIRHFGRSTSISVGRSEEHTSELQSLMRISYAVFCLKKKKNNNKNIPQTLINHHTI